MSNTTNNHDSESQSFIGCEENVALLGVEIRFWKEMIEYREAGTPDESVERMQQALCLAQSRLKRLLQQHTVPDPTITGSGPMNGCETPAPEDNVVCLEWWRRR